MSWVLTEQDLQDLTSGAGILGTGGGGNRTWATCMCANCCVRAHASPWC
jgi:DUF917 family protein